MIDPTSPDWMRLRRHVRERLETLRDELEKPHPPEHTAAVRGRIAELRHLIDLVEPRVEPAIEESERRPPLYG